MQESIFSNSFSSFVDEATLLQFAREPAATHNQTTASAPKNTLPIDGPFTLTTMKDRLYREAVGGLGYPRSDDNAQELICGVLCSSVYQR